MIPLAGLAWGAAKTIASSLVLEAVVGSATSYLQGGGARPTDNSPSSKNSNTTMRIPSHILLDAAGDALTRLGGVAAPSLARGGRSLASLSRRSARGATKEAADAAAHTRAISGFKNKLAKDGEASVIGKVNVSGAEKSVKRPKLPTYAKASRRVRSAQRSNPRALDAPDKGFSLGKEIGLGVAMLAVGELAAGLYNWFTTSPDEDDMIIGPEGLPPEEIYPDPESTEASLNPDAAATISEALTLGTLSAREVVTKMWLNDKDSGLYVFAYNFGQSMAVPATIVDVEAAALAPLLMGSMEGVTPLDMGALTKKMTNTIKAMSELVLTDPVVRRFAAYIAYMRNQLASMARDTSILDVQKYSFKDVMDLANRTVAPYVQTLNNMLNVENSISGGARAVREAFSRFNLPDFMRPVVFTAFDVSEEGGSSDLAIRDAVRAVDKAVETLKRSMSPQQWLDMAAYLQGQAANIFVDEYR